MVVTKLSLLIQSILNRRKIFPLTYAYFELIQKHNYASLRLAHLLYCTFFITRNSASDPDERLNSDKKFICASTFAILRFVVVLSDATCSIRRDH